MSWISTLTPWLRALYVVLSLGLGVAVLYVMEQLHELRGAPGGRRVPFNVMRGLMLTLVVAVATIFIYLTLPSQKSTMPVELVVAFRLRDLAGIAGTLCYVVGLWQIFRQRGPELRGARSETCAEPAAPLDLPHSPPRRHHPRDLHREVHR